MYEHRRALGSAPRVLVSLLSITTVGHHLLNETHRTVPEYNNSKQFFLSFEVSASLRYIVEMKADLFVCSLHRVIITDPEMAKK